MEYHKQLIKNILSEEELEGFEREQRKDELEHLSTETLEGMAKAYEEEEWEREVEMFAQFARNRV